MIIRPSPAVAPARTGTPDPAEWSRQAAELNQPAILQQASFHPGRLPGQSVFAAFEPTSVLLSALKSAEEKDGLILRAYNCAAAAVQARLALPHWGREIQAAFGPFEVKTFKIPFAPDQPIHETNLLEDPLTAIS